MILAFPVPGQESLQVCAGDPENTIEPVGYKLSGVDPATNRPGRDIQRFGDVGDGEKPHVCAIAPTANGVSRMNLPFNGSTVSHVSGPRWMQPSPPHATAVSAPACASMSRSAANGTLIRRPNRTDGL